MQARQLRFFGIAVMAGTLVGSGCVSRKYVDEQIAAVNAKITTVSNQTRENGEKIDAVDVRAKQGIADAATARTAAATADTKATQAQTTAQSAQSAAQTAQTAATGAAQTATAANQGVTAAGTRITTVENRLNSLNLSSIERYTAGPTQSVMFKLDSANLDDAAKKTLDGVAGQVASLAGGFMIEVQGFASAEGGDTYNLALSQKRADAVQRYLVGKNVPLFRVALVGLGVDKPIGDNKTKAGREQNRRVELRVLRAN